MKLRKLILCGFKSFADRTEFDFDDGVSCVVGPNGCGKSNIVDAIKWVLGEQSAKSLRGSEMADVIFNGSARRRPSGVAEVTLVFDNSQSLLRPEVEGAEAVGDAIAIGRRLYRNGDSEYLINKTPCRLRDVRELFMDTGIGHDAYAVIEQGRVESFLQASPPDRRALFDEAAGISKYKARKKEALRKLERVEQNLLRLDDIFREVEKRLRSIKYQAGKARSYQAHSEKLGQLKGLYFLAQYHTLLEKRTEIQSRTAGYEDALRQIAHRLDDLEKARSGTEVEAAELERTAAELQNRAGSLEAQLTAHGQRRAMLAEKVQELQGRMAAVTDRCDQLERTTDTCAQQQQQQRQEIARLEETAARLAEESRQAAQARDENDAALAALERRLEEAKAEAVELLRQAAQLHNEVQTAGVRRENLEAQKKTLAGKAQEIAGRLGDLAERRTGQQQRLEEMRRTIDSQRGTLEQRKQALGEARDGEQAMQAQLAELRERRSAAAGRVEVLQDMLRRFEGIESGTKRVLEARASGRLTVIRGMLGEFIETDVRHAAVVEAALAGADQQLIVDRFDLVEGAAAELKEILGDSGAVEIVCLDRLAPCRYELDAATGSQILGRAVDWVRFDPWVAPVVWRVLGRTLVVRTLSDAVALAARVAEGFRFVTLGGEVLESDGRVRIGSANRATGIVSRRSELGELTQQMAEMDGQIQQAQAALENARGRREELEGAAHDLRTAIYEASTECVEAEGALAALQQQVAELEEEGPLVAGDIASVEEEIAQVAAVEADARRRATEFEQANAARRSEVEQLEQGMVSARQRREELAAKMTELKVSQAQVAEKKVSLTESLESLTRQSGQLAQDLAAARAEIERNGRQMEEAQTAIRDSEAEEQQLHQQRAALDEEAQRLQQTRQGLQERLEEIRAQVSQVRQSQEAESEKAGACRVELAQTDAHVEDLIARASDEMHTDLPQAYTTYEHDENRDWNAVEAEINELRAKIERLGNVNLDAIAEQDELEQRRAFLTAQLKDVKDSRNQINELIRRINRESREKFMETFESVRRNFQELFRKLFGGGRADVILSDPEDVLESGIEILARPPGKELRSLSLLSGGEKTMTALALMFSMFKHRPSPFCLLDEVDAALDEANTERFGRLVRECMQESQFLIISHAKRTISMASVLYGVTMQEAGVSKRVSIRFEDVGHKLDAQLKPVGN